MLAPSKLSVPRTSPVTVTASVAASPILMVAELISDRGASMVRLPLLMLVTPVRSMASVASFPILISSLSTLKTCPSRALTIRPVTSLVSALSLERAGSAITTVPLASGKVMFLSALGSVTDKVVSKLFDVRPSKTKSVAMVAFTVRISESSSPRVTLSSACRSPVTSSPLLASRFPSMLALSSTSREPLILVATPEAARSVWPATSSVPSRSVLSATVRFPEVTSTPLLASRFPSMLALSSTSREPLILVATPEAARSV